MDGDVVPGIGSNRKKLRHADQEDPDPRPESRDPDLHVDGEREHGEHDAGERPWAGRKHGRTRTRQHGAHRADRTGDADAGGEELEHEQREPGEQQQVGHRRAGDRVEQLVDERQLGEAHGGDRVETGRSVVEHDEVGRRQHDAVLLEPVERLHHVA